MFFELRTYDLKPGKAPVYLEFFRTFGVAHVTRHLPMAGYWMVESGRLNRIQHLWIYADFAERDAARAALSGEVPWVQDFLPRAFVDVVAQENRIMALERGSPALEAVIAARRDTHANQPADVPMFAPALQGLAFSATPDLPGGDPLAQFRVLSGAAPGSFVTLTDNPLEALPGPAATRHELLRPLSLSPLR